MEDKGSDRALRNDPKGDRGVDRTVSRVRVTVTRRGSDHGLSRERRTGRW